MGCGLCKSSLTDQSKCSIHPAGKLFTVPEEQSELEESNQVKAMESRAQTLLSAALRIGTRNETLEEEKVRTDRS